MSRRFLPIYQVVAGLSDSLTGLLLLAAPSWTLRLMHLQADPATLPFLSWIGAFVLSTGLACFYGALLLIPAERADAMPRLETVWLLTLFTRALVAAYVLFAIAHSTLAVGWITVAFTDGAFALFQTVGLMRGWLSDARR